MTKEKKLLLKSLLKEYKQSLIQDNIPDFKVGDKVKFKKGDYDWKSRRPYIGKIATVLQVDYNRDALIVQFRKSNNGGGAIAWPISYFQLVK